MLQLCVYDIKYAPSVFGFNNTGVICWYNSLLQLLLSLPSLNKLLLTNELLFQNNLFAMEYIQLIKKALSRDDQLSSVSSHLLHTMINLMKQKNKTDFGYSQECVDEALILILDMFDNSMVTNLFMIKYKYTIYCNSCKQITSDTVDRYYRIQISPHIKFDNKDDFCNYLRNRQVNCDNYKCICGTVSPDSVRQEELRALREVIVITINKFSVKDPYWFPQELTFNNGELTYKLISKIEHSGNSAGGHYWIQTLRDKWYTINDISVTNGDPRPSHYTFIIVYHLFKQ